MVGKNNSKLRRAQSANKVTRFGLKKLACGVTSVALGATLVFSSAVNVVNAQTADDATATEAPTTYSVRYEVRNTDGEVVKVLQEEAGWDNWAAMEQASVAVANAFGEEYGRWNVEANVDGFVYYFVQEDEAPTTYTVRYEVRNTDGEVVKVLQEEAGWEDWAAMEQASVAVANAFGEEYGGWNVEANVDGLVYYFVQPDPETYYVRYEVRNEAGEVLEVLQTEEGWEDWEAMREASVVVADQFAEEHGLWDVEAYPEGLVYVFTREEETPEDPETYYVRYEVRNEAGEVLEVLQTEEGWEDWEAMREASVVVADQFGQEHGPWNVEANVDGLVYYFVQREEVPEDPEKPKDDKKEDPKKDTEKAELPATGEASDLTLFSAASVAILAGLGLVAPKTKKED